MGIITDKEMGSKPNGADQWFTDPAPRGAGRFLGRITSGGERSFYFRYTTSTGQRDTLAVGAYDPKGREGYLTLAAAREKAAGWSKQYKDGARDLRQHFAKLDGKRIGRKDGGQYVREQFERRVFATLGGIAVMDVRKADILAILDAVKAEGKLRTANMLLADLKQMFRFAAEREIIEHSPIELISKRKVGGKDIKRDRVLSNDELAALVKQLSNGLPHR